MSTIRIDTSQNVQLECSTANTIERIIAYLIDLSILGIYFYFLYKLTSLNGFDLFTDSDKLTEREFFLNIFIFLPIFFYDLLFEVFNAGQTPGKMILRLRVIKTTGEAAGFGEYAIRWLLRPIDIYGGVIFYISISELISPDAQKGLIVLFLLPIGIVAILSTVFNKNGQRIGDYFAGTCMIKHRKNYSINDTILQKTKSDYKVTYLNVLKLSDKDVRLIKDTLEYYTSSNDLKYLEKLSKKAQEFLEIENIDQPYEFLQRLMRDYNHLAMEEDGRN